jgi:hypothetical protein
MAELYVKVDGQMVPLVDCDWVFSRTCGHPFGLLVAQLRGSSRDSYATQEQAWRELYPRSRDRQAAQRRGVTARLAVHTTLDDEFWQHMKEGCQCATRADSKETGHG